MALARQAKFVEVDPCKTLSFLQKIQALASKIYAIRTACVSCQFVYLIYNCNSQSLFCFFSGDVFFPATCKFHQCQRCKARVSLKKLTKFFAVTLYLGIVVCVGHALQWTDWSYLLLYPPMRWLTVLHFKFVLSLLNVTPKISPCS